MQKMWKRQFFILWLGQAASILTSSISQYALIWYLTVRTGSAAVLSVAAIAALLPQGLLSPFTGAVADRFDRRKIMALADGSIAVVTLGLVALSAAWSQLPVTAVMVALTLRSVGSAFHTPCLQAVTPLIVPPDRLNQCAGWSQGVQTVSLLASPALAALLYAAVPLSAILVLDVLGAAIAITALVLARLPELRSGSTAVRFSLLSDTRAGVALLKSRRWLWQLCLICALFSLAVMPISALFPLLCIGYFGGTTLTASAVETLFSVGMLLASVLLGLWGRIRNRILIMAGALFFLSACLLCAGQLKPDAFRLFLPLSFGMGFSTPLFSSLMTALLQQKIEGDFLGRVLGMSSAIMTLASPIGLAASGLFAERVGIIHWLSLAGCGTLLCGVLCLALPAVRRCDHPPLDEKSSASGKTRQNAV